MTANDALTKGDLLLERGASFLEELAQKASAEGGLAAKLAEPLADDALFLRKVKPSLVAARLRGEQPSEDGSVEPSAPAPPPAAAESSRDGGSGRLRGGGGAGAKALAAVGAAFIVGIFVAKVIDWRGHAHPKD